MKSLKIALLSSVLILTPLAIQAQASAKEYKSFVKNADSKVVFVTGSNRGQGLGWVKYYLGTGDSVVATCRKPKEAGELIALSKKYGGKMLLEQLDVVDEESINGLGARLAKHGVKIDLLVSNAGVTLLQDFGEWTYKGWEFNIGVNTIGAALVAQMVAPQLNDGGMVLQISSGAGIISTQKRSNDLDPYSVSKAGLNMLTKKLAARLKDRNIIVISMTPGGVLTDMNPNGKLSVEEAIDIMSKTISEMTMENTGMFYNNFGKEMPW